MHDTCIYIYTHKKILQCRRSVIYCGEDLSIEEAIVNTHLCMILLTMVSSNTVINNEVCIIKTCGCPHHRLTIYISNNRVLEKCSHSLTQCFKALSMKSPPSQTL